MSNSHRADKIKLLQRITKGQHSCGVCISGKCKTMRGKNQFVRMRRSVGC